MEFGLRFCILDHWHFCGSGFICFWGLIEDKIIIRIGSPGMLGVIIFVRQLHVRLAMCCNSRFCGGCMIAGIDSKDGIR